MSKTVVERAAVAVAVGRDGRRMGMGEDGRTEGRTEDKTDRTTGGAAVSQSVKEGGREGNTSCVKQVAILLQLDRSGRGRSEIAQRRELVSCPLAQEGLVSLSRVGRSGRRSR